MSTQRVRMAGRTYTFVPDVVGGYRIGHLINSLGRFSGHVMVYPPSAGRQGRRMLISGPSGISRDAEREALEGIEL